MRRSHRVAQVSKLGELEIAERETPSPGAGDVLIAVEACGICGADAGDIDRADPKMFPARVPGHEVVGRIATLGAGVPSIWKIGQRVGIGRLGGHCNQCAQCRRGEFQLCMNQPFVGSTCDGGYAEMMIARATGLVSIPDELKSEEAAPLLCAGIATFNALKKCGAEAGDTVVVQGIGGLGHLALQYARRMGFRVVAVGRGADISTDAITLGAHVYIDSKKEDPVARLQGLGGVKAIITTIGDVQAVAALTGALAPQGRLVLLGAGKDPLPVSPGHIVVGERSILGSITGTPFENEKTLDFSVLAAVRPRIEIMPLEKAGEAVARMRSGQANFRMVLTMTEANHAHQ
ncbi:zinc-binding dehydrogenase [Bradyrhizobium manausense]|uniref:zinc-binding dehydrogenase n=1 Tax=Bradyrhizobium manausense TaxID=989370 RepID=UPI001BA84E56|nr:alcohol dehydrogenase catalytic domain-containing protein [Bradyrhizobium manausense]MBR0724982.1 alcohol dehydrogenase catalytic domain-containing protein [Bradyrhizobium manausense]